VDAANERALHGAAPWENHTLDPGGFEGDAVWVKLSEEDISGLPVLDEERVFETEMVFVLDCEPNGDKEVGATDGVDDADCELAEQNIVGRGQKQEKVHTNRASEAHKPHTGRACNEDQDEDNTHAVVDLVGSTVGLIVLDFVVDDELLRVAAGEHVGLEDSEGPAQLGGWYGSMQMHLDVRFESVSRAHTPCSLQSAVCEHDQGLSQQGTQAANETGGGYRVAEAENVRKA
jgi:hypothetical protein